MSALETQVGGSHYSHGKIQPVQYIEANKLQFLEGCVVKRVTRHDKPGGKGKQDIEKAIHELQLLLEQRYPVDVLPGDHPQPVYEDVDWVSRRASLTAQQAGAAKMQDAFPQNSIEAGENCWRAIEENARAAQDASKVAEPDADGWIAWGGGECPVVAMTSIDVRYRDGKEARNIPAQMHHCIPNTRNATDWSRDGFNEDSDIVAYRLAQDEPQWPMVSEPGDHSKIKAAYKPGMEWNYGEGDDEWFSEPDERGPIWMEELSYAIRPAQGAPA